MTEGNEIRGTGGDGTATGIDGRRSVAVRDRILDWSLAGVGLVGAAGVGFHLAVDESALTTRLLETAIPSLLAGVVLVAGVALERSELQPRQVGMVAGGALLGAVVTAAVDLGLTALSANTTVTTQVTVYRIVTGSSWGAAIGTGLGYFYVRERRARRQIDRSRTAVVALYRASSRLTRAGTEAEVAEVAVDLARDVLETPYAVVWKHDAGEAALVPLAVSDAVGELEEGPPTYGDLSAAMAAFEADEPRTHDDAIERGVVPPETGLETVLYAPIGDWGVFGFGRRGEERGSAAGDAGFTPDDERLAALLASRTATEMARVDRERELREQRAIVETLHDVTREMVAESDPERVYRLVSAAARDVLDLPVNGIFVADETGERLEPAVTSEAAEDLFGGVATFESDDESLAWRVYERGEAAVYDDVSEIEGVYNPETPVASEAILPLGDRGLFLVAAEEPHEFDPEDVFVLRLLAANAEVALERAEREAELETQTSRMEFFNSILRHDVLNGMTVIGSRAAALAERTEGAEAEYAETIVDWTDDVVDVVERVRTVLDALTGEGSVETVPVAAGDLLRSELDRVRATHPAVEVDADIADVTVLADELLAEVFGNLLTNAVKHNDPEGLRLRVRLRESDGRAVVRVEDSGSGVPEEMREAVFRRGETAHAKTTGSGFGLFFVDAMVAEYGGSVHVEESDLGGAAFVVELPVHSPE